MRFVFLGQLVLLKFHAGQSSSADRLFITLPAPAIDSHNSTSLVPPKPPPHLLMTVSNTCMLSGDISDSSKLGGAGHRRKDRTIHCFGYCCQCFNKS